MMNNQNGMSIIENLVAMTVLSIAGFGFIATSVASIGMMKTGVERSAAARAASSVANTLYYQRGNRAGLAAELISFPKTVVEDETHKTYTVEIASLNNHVGSAVSASALPKHGVMVMTLAVNYSERPGLMQSVKKTLHQTYTMDF